MKTSLYNHFGPIIFSICLLFWWTISFGQVIRVDSCGINDACEKAILIPNVVSDQPFVCIEGCNLNASPSPVNNNCGIGDFPTVWFKVLPDGNATLININVKSDEFDSPTITLFHSIAGCSNLQIVSMTQSYQPFESGSVCGFASKSSPDSNCTND